MLFTHLIVTQTIGGFGFWRIVRGWKGFKIFSTTPHTGSISSPSSAIGCDASMAVNSRVYEACAVQHQTGSK